LEHRLDDTVFASAELRKQSGELRRYRRLSRSGRLSIAPAARTASEQSTCSLGTLAELEDEDQRLSGLEEDSDLDDLEDEDLDEDLDDEFEDDLDDDFDDLDDEEK